MGAPQQARATPAPQAPPPTQPPKPQQPAEARSPRKAPARRAPQKQDEAGEQNPLELVLPDIPALEEELEG
jgi:hypothetical protein